MISPRDFKYCLYARTRPPRSDPSQARCNQDPVVTIQRDNICNGAKRNQIQCITQIGWLDPSLGKPIALPERCPQSAQHIEHHTYPREGFTGKRATGLIGVNNHVCLWQLRSGQVMIGNQYANTQLARGGDPLNTRYSIINRDNEIWHLGGRQFDNFRR